MPDGVFDAGEGVPIERTLVLGAADELLAPPIDRTGAADAVEAGLGAVWAG